MRALLFLDLLGVRAEWHDEGRTGAEKAFARFRNLAQDVIQAYDSSHFVAGGIESDSLALACDSELTAASVGMDIYVQAFMRATEETSPRAWIRGSIVPMDNPDLRSLTHLAHPFDQIEVFDYSGALLDAISVEKSGIKGMRLLLHQRLITIELQDAVSVSFSGNRLERIIQLPYTPSPKRIEEEGYQDLLWMAHPDSWEELRVVMNERLQWAVKHSQEEFLQAAATQVVFHECAGAIEATVSGR